VLWWSSGHASRGYFTPIFLAPWFGVEGPTIETYQGPQKNYARVLNSWVKVSDEFFGLAEVVLGLGARTAQLFGYTAGIEPNEGSLHWVPLDPMEPKRQVLQNKKGGACTVCG